MADNTRAFHLLDSSATTGVGANQRASGLHPERAPDFIWGQGTPDGDRSPFTNINKGSLYMQTNTVDDMPTVWMKVDEAGANTDWVAIGGLQFAVSKNFNIDNGAGTTDDDIILVPNRAITIVSARNVYTEALGSGNAEGANVRLGTAVAGTQIVGATSHGGSQAVGSIQDLVIASGAIAADGMVAVRHTGVATTVAGAYYVQISYY